LAENRGMAAIVHGARVVASLTFGEAAKRAGTGFIRVERLCNGAGEVAMTLVKRPMSAR